MIKFLLHGSYDDIGISFQQKLNDSGKYKVVHWIGHIFDNNPDRFDQLIVDAHVGEIRIIY